MLGWNSCSPDRSRRTAEATTSFSNRKRIALMSDSHLRLSRRVVLGTVMAGAINAPSALAQQAAPVVPITIDLREKTSPLPHIWAECVGSDRAAITLRETWRKDLDRWVSEAGLKRVRFHGILNDELGVF